MPNEFELIQRYFSGLSQGSERVALGVGDDAALLNAPSPGHHLVVATDTLVADVHFPSDASPVDLAWRCLAVNVSDLAAMGALPIAYTLALTLPQAEHTWLAEFSEGLVAAQSQYGIRLVGGDTTRGPLNIGITTLGEVPIGEAMQRNTAKAGDGIYVDGTLGDGGAALALLRRGELASDAYLHGRFYRPNVEIGQATRLRKAASAAIDVSDGLLADLGHILEGSKVGAIIELDSLPVSNQAKRASESLEQMRAWALGAGDDYRLCYTIADAQRSVCAADLKALYRIGTVSEAPGVQLQYSDGRIENVDTGGYKHFD